MRPWTVTPHDPIEKLEDNLWTVDGDLPGVRLAVHGGYRRRRALRRRMFIVKRGDGSLLFSGAAIPLDDRALAEVTAWGRPSILVVPHHWHMMDARAFAARLGVGIYCPGKCETRVRRRAEIAGTLEVIPPDPSVTVEPVAGARTGEPALIVTSGAGRRCSLLLADAIQNTPRPAIPFALRWLGFGGGPKVTPAFRTFFLQDRRALRAQLERWAELPGLFRLVPCHGTIVSEGVAAALRAAAATL